MYYFSDELARHMQQEDAYDVLQAAKGKVFRRAPGRRTFQLTIGGRSYFAKIHTGVGWLEIIKNLVQLRLPVLGAGTEWRAIESLKELGLETLNPVAFGTKGWNPATRKSFIVTEEISNSINLEDLSANWPQSPPNFRTKMQLIAEIAGTSRTLHENGIFHRDYYLCHFLFQKTSHDNYRLSLIDLHRALIKPLQRKRWRIKDIAGLYFSARNSGLSKRDCYRFMRAYSAKTLRQCMAEDAGFWQQVVKRSARMAERDAIKLKRRAQVAVI